MVIVQPLPAFGFESDFFDLIMWRGGSNFCQIHRVVPDFRFLFGGRSGSGNDWGGRGVRPRETNRLGWGRTVVGGLWWRKLETEEEWIGVDKYMIHWSGEPPDWGRTVVGGLWWRKLETEKEWIGVDKYMVRRESCHDTVIFQSKNSKLINRLKSQSELAVWFVQLRVQSGIYLRVLKNHQAFRSSALYLRAFQQHLQIHNLGVGTEELFDDHSCIMVIASMTEFVDEGICAHPLSHRVLQLHDHQFCLRWGLAPVGQTIRQ